MKKRKENEVENLGLIREKINSKDSSLEEGIKHLARAQKIYRQLKTSLFKKRGEVMIAKEKEDGTYSVHKFTGEE